LRLKQFLSEAGLFAKIYKMLLLKDLSEFAFFCGWYDKYIELVKMQLNM